MSGRGWLRAAAAAALAVIAAVAAPAQPAAGPFVAASHPAPGKGLRGPVARVTFNNQVVRILQARCQTCHHEGSIAPFPLMTYEDAYDHRIQMQIVTSSRQMPPWHADSACTAYAGDPSLTPDEIGTFTAWLRTGSPRGDPSDLPPPRTFSGDWRLGEPDQVLTMPEPFQPDFSKGDLYRCFVFPTNLTADRFLSALEVKPGQPAMVHHVLAYIDTTDAAEALDQSDPGPGYTCFGGPGFGDRVPVAAWAPGNQPPRLPDGVGIPVPKASRIVLQIHYSPRSGVDAPDSTSLGLFFSTSTVKKRWLWLPMNSDDFVLPAGNPNCQVLVSTVLTQSIHALAITPHMHLLGRTMRVDATMPDGSRRCLVSVPRWDLRWQDTYRYQTSLALPAGTRLDLVATYDNSDMNPDNPNVPPLDVRWGEAATAEMCLLYVHGTLDDEDLPKDPGALAIKPNVFEYGPGQPPPRGPGPAAQ